MFQGIFKNIITNLQPQLHTFKRDVKLDSKVKPTSSVDYRSNREKSDCMIQGKIAEVIVTEMFKRCGYIVRNYSLEGSDKFDPRESYSEEDWGRPDIKVIKPSNNLSALFQVKYRSDPSKKSRDSVVNSYIRSHVEGDKEVHLLLVTPKHFGVTYQFASKEGV
jgi:hypothetical protein